APLPQPRARGPGTCIGRRDPLRDRPRPGGSQPHPGGARSVHAGGRARSRALRRLAAPRAHEPSARPRRGSRQRHGPRGGAAPGRRGPARETAPPDFGAAGRREGERRPPSMRRERGSARPKPPAGRPPEPARRAQPLRWLRHPAALSAVLALALYWPATGGGFVWDDHWLVESDPGLRATRQAWSGGMVSSLITDFWET